MSRSRSASTSSPNNPAPDRQRSTVPGQPPVALSRPEDVVVTPHRTNEGCAISRAVHPHAVCPQGCGRKGAESTGKSLYRSTGPLRQDAKRASVTRGARQAGRGGGGGGNTATGSHEHAAGASGRGVRRGSSDR